MGKCLVFVILGLSIAMTVGCASPYRRDQGAAFGGLTGAGLGAAIGSASGNPLKGTAIGGAVGALTGAVVGNELDYIDQRNQAMIQQSLGRRIEGATTANDVVAMSQAGLGSDVIIRQLQTSGFQGSLGAPELISLKQQGVSDSVIRAMQDLGNARPPAAVAARPRPVIVEEYHYAPPFHPRHYWHRRACAPRSGFGWHVAVGH